MTNIQSLFIIFIIIFVSDDTVIFGTNVDQNYIIFKYVIYVFLIIYLYVFKIIANGKNIIQNKFSKLFIYLIIIAFLLSIIANSEIRNGNILQFLIILLSIFIVRGMEFKSFVEKYCSILFYISLFSLVLFTFSIIARPVVELLPTLQNYENVEFLNAGFALVFKNAANLRNLGFFREPGVFAIYLSVGLMIELFYNAQLNPKRVFIFAVSLISTVSTSGYLIGFMLLSGYFFRQSPGKAIIMLLAGAALIYSFYDPILNVFAKFDEESAQYSSALARISSLSVPFNIFINSPIYGSGLTGFSDEYFLVSQQLYGFPIDPARSSTNTILNMFAIYGIVLGSLWVTGLLRLAFQISKNPLIALIGFLSLLLIYSSQELRFSLFFSCLLMFGLLSKTEKRA